MKSSTVYCKIDNPQRKSDCSFGSAGFNQTVCVGTSSSNSHDFLDMRVERSLLEDGNGYCFTLWLDGIMMKRAVVKNGEYDEFVNEFEKHQ